MPTQTQFGQTLFLRNLGDASAAEKLDRIHFSKNGLQGAPFSEAWLQRLIMRNRSLLPVDQIESAFNALVPICIELPMRCGFLDNLFLTPDGNIALVECKLWRNPEARREVVAQIIDYATEMSTWSYETLQAAVQRTKSLEGPDNEKRSLYELASANGDIDEASFHDAVSRNLKRGRFLLLIVGDGIREGMEGMAEFLQQHAGFHFTLGLIEIALFAAPDGYIAQPRIIAKTTNIERGIVMLDEGRMVVKPSTASQVSGINGGRKTSITQEEYFEQLKREFPAIVPEINAFLDELADYHVMPEFGTDSMILRWRPGDGKNWNLGTVTSHGNVWMDYLGMQANSAGVLEPHMAYLTQLAAIVPNAYIKKTKTETSWNVAYSGKSLTVDLLVAPEDRRKKWVQAIADFQSAVMKGSLGD
jgi:hypothetical protein